MCFYMYIICKTFNSRGTVVSYIFYLLYWIPFCEIYKCHSLHCFSHSVFVNFHTHFYSAQNINKAITAIITYCVWRRDAFWFLYFLRGNKIKIKFIIHYKLNFINTLQEINWLEMIMQTSTNLVYCNIRKTTCHSICLLEKQAKTMFGKTHS